MTFHNPQVDVGVPNYGREWLSFHLVAVVQDETELLLVHSGGCQAPPARFPWARDPAPNQTLPDQATDLAR